MKLNKQLFLSELIRSRTFCDQGVDHGSGSFAWMHPPVHRILGWATKPSNLSLSRDIWKLNQLRGLSNQQAFVKGLPSNSDQATLERLPTLLGAHLLNIKSTKIASIVDLIFDVKTGKILYYLVSRSDPRIPGTSRWRLSIDQILDQQPGIVKSDLHFLDDLPLIKSSVKQDIMSKSKTFRHQIQEITNKASLKLEGWLEEPPWQDNSSDYLDSQFKKRSDSFEDWSDYSSEKETFDTFGNENVINSPTQTSVNSLDYEEDPWI